MKNPTNRGVSSGSEVAVAWELKTEKGDTNKSQQPPHNPLHYIYK